MRAVGGGVRRDDELELVGGIVEREQVLEPPLDHRLLVVGGDDHAHDRLDLGPPHATRAQPRERGGNERVAEVRPEQCGEARPEEDFERDHDRRWYGSGTPEDGVQLERPDGATGVPPVVRLESPPDRRPRCVRRRYESLQRELHQLHRMGAVLGANVLEAGGCEQLDETPLVVVALVPEPAVVDEIDRPERERDRTGRRSAP